MTASAGIIYNVGGGRYGLALHKEQIYKPSGRVLLRVYTDCMCTIAELNENNEQTKIIKHITEIRQVGYNN